MMAHVNETRLVLASIEVASGMFSRMRGLLGREDMPPGHGLLISPCSSIHTFGMRFDLDVLFLDREGVVVHRVRDVKPCRIVRGGRRARSVVEARAGWLASTLVDIGDRLTLCLSAR